MAREAKLYVLVRNDIPVPDQAVQACHAVEQWAANNQKRSGATVLLSISVSNVGYWIRKICQRGLVPYTFEEPDLGNAITAIACLTDTSIFDRLPLWTGEPNSDPVY